MIIPKGRTISWAGVTYRPGQKVAPAHKAKVRALLLRGGQMPAEEEVDQSVEPIPEEEPVQKPEEIEIATKPPPPAVPTNLIDVTETEEEPEEESKPKKRRTRKKKESEVDES